MLRRGYSPGRLARACEVNTKTVERWIALDRVPHRDNCQIRLHSTTLYASIFRYDDIMLANPHMWGAPASANPVLHLRRIEGSSWFDGYRRSFDAVWETARPWDPLT